MQGRGSAPPLLKCFRLPAHIDVHAQAGDQCLERWDLLQACQSLDEVMRSRRHCHLAGWQAGQPVPGTGSLWDVSGLWLSKIA